jgi:hypothetical protein
MPIGPGAKEQALGHMLSPEGHRSAHDHCVDAVLLGEGSGRERVRPGPDDKELRGDRQYAGADMLEFWLADPGRNLHWSIARVHP